MSSANKAKGSRWENQVADFWQMDGVNAKRLRLNGTEDVGDIEIPLKQQLEYLIVEAKDWKTHNFTEFLRQADIEAENYVKKYPLTKAAYPVAIVKARRKSVGEAYVVMRQDRFLELLRDLGAL